MAAGSGRRGLADLVRPGMRVALGDGCGTPQGLHPVLTRAGGDVGGVTLVLGWVPRARPALDATAFTDVRCVVGGAGVRADVDAGRIRVVPTRLSAVPALLAGPLRPDLLVVGLVRDPDGPRLGSESAWMRRLIENTDVPVAGAESTVAPHSDAGHRSRTSTTAACSSTPRSAPTLWGPGVSTTGPTADGCSTPSRSCTTSDACPQPTDRH